MINEGIPIAYRHVDGILAGLNEAGFEVIVRPRASGGLGTLWSTRWGEFVDPGADLRGWLRGTSCLEKTEGGANDSAKVP